MPDKFAAIIPLISGIANIGTGMSTFATIPAGCSFMIYSLEDRLSTWDHILPKGDQYDPPPGTGQFSLASLLWLLGTASVTAACCRWLDLGIGGFVLILTFHVYVWWLCAQKRKEITQREQVDQTELREEVRRWLEAKGGGRNGESGLLNADR